jgi:hypothetical protein
MMGEIADAAGLPPDLAYAIRRTGLVVTDRNKDLLDTAQTAAIFVPPVTGMATVVLSLAC